LISKTTTENIKGEREKETFFVCKWSHVLIFGTGGGNINVRLMRGFKLDKISTLERKMANKTTFPAGTELGNRFHDRLALDTSKI
jgi:hypothetical protein